MKNKEILKVQFTKINEDYHVGVITYQDENILKRKGFIDRELDVHSGLEPMFNSDGSCLFIKGESKKQDNQPIIIKNEHLEDLKERINKLNEKYGRKEIWRPKKNENYYYLSMRHNPIKRRYLCQDWEQLLSEVYATFPTFELAKKGKYMSLLDRMQLLYQYQNNLIFDVDWRLWKQPKFKIGYKVSENKLVCLYAYTNKEVSVYWENEKDLEQFMGIYKNEILEIFKSYNQE